MHKPKKEIIQIALKTQERLKKSPTIAELKFLEIIKSQGISYQSQFIVFSHNSFFIADFVITSRNGKKYLVEIDGGYHNTYAQKKKDRNRSACIRKKNYGVLRLSNDDVLKNPTKVLRKLKRYEIGFSKKA